MAKIFICYRHDDSGAAVGRIYDRLEAHFGRAQVFTDLDEIPHGVDWRDWLDRQIRRADLVLAVIGRNWLRSADAGSGRRRDAPRDDVRTEIEIALALDRGIPLIQVLVDGVAMPQQQDLPDSIKSLVHRQHLSVHTTSADFRDHMARLIGEIERLTKELVCVAAPPPPDTPRPEIQGLLADLADPATKPEHRLDIGDRLAELGDPRPGVGVGADGRPAIDWVVIPAGNFLCGDKKERCHHDAFRIGRVPITNTQYQAFIAVGGYQESRWWEGLAHRPESPTEPRWKQPNRPRERVSWYEAMAYCTWLSDALGLIIRLPTQWEWERAARGTDGREYPWGNGYRAGYANINETVDRAGRSYLEQTTAVGLYPHGASPEGVLDLSGNVWEWCLNESGDPKRSQPGGTGSRVVRGGSWLNDHHHARAAYRYGYDPHNRNGGLGFRVLCPAAIH